MRILISLTLAASLSIFGCSADVAGSSSGADSAGDDTTTTTGGDTAGATNGGATDGGAGTGDTGRGDTGGGDTGGGDTGAAASDPLARGASQALGSFARTEAAVVQTASGHAWCNGTLAEVNGESHGLPADCIAVAADEDIVALSTTDDQWHIIQAGTIQASAAGPAPLGMALGGGKIFAAMGAAGVISAPMDLGAAPTDVAGAKDARAVLTLADGTLLVADGVHGVLLMDGAGGGESSRLDGPQAFAPATSLAWITEDAQAVVGFGGFGIAIVDIAGGALSYVSNFETEGLVLDVATRDGMVLTAEWNLTRLIDIRTPSAPVLVGREDFGIHRAVSVAATDDGFMVLGIDHATDLVPAPEVVTAELHLDRRYIQVEVVEQFGGIGGAGILVYNTGRADLHVSNLAISDGSIDIGSLLDSGVEGVDLVVSTGGVEFIELTINGIAPREANFTFDSNDVDNPSVTIKLDINPTPIAVGAPAPDFILPTMDGPMFRLSELEEAVVHMKPFNSLCATCAEALPEIEAELNQPLASQGYQGLCIHVGPDVAYGISTANDTGITFPMVLDFDNTVLTLYSRIGSGSPLFPLAYLTNRDLSISDIYVDDEPLIGDLKTRVQDLLSE
jgi:peroxiredoxin